MTRAELIERLEKGETGNEMDIAIEIALFEPDADYSAIRANAAGTKVIYTKRSGAEVTHWAGDHSMGLRRERTIALLRALEAKDQRA